MATVTIDPGPNPTIPYKTDLVGSDNVPLLKIDKGAEGASSPVTDANPLPIAGVVSLDPEQDSTKRDEVTYGNFAGVGVPWADSNTETNGWKPWPTDGDGQTVATPKASMFARDVVSEQPAAIYSTTTTPSASGGVRGIITRAIQYVIDVGGNFRSPLSDLTGRLLINIDRLADTLIATGNGAADAGTMRVTLANDSTGVITATPNRGYISGTIDTATGNVTLSGIRNYSGVGVFIRGTYAGINLTPEVSDDGIAFSTCSIYRQDTPQVQQTTGALTNTIRSWVVPTMGADHFRMRATARTSGTMGVAIVAVTGAIPTGIVSIPSGTTAVSGTVSTNEIASTNSGGTPYLNLDLNNTGVSIKGSKTFVGALNAFNTTGATIYLKVYNKATAATSADIPIQVYGIAAGQPAPIDIGKGLSLSLGFSVRCVTGVANADTTSPAVNGCVFSAVYT